MLDCFSCITPNWLHRAFVYTGSVGPFDRDFRYRLEQDEANGQIHAAAYSKTSYEVADDVEKADFSWDDEGVESLRQWLQAHYEAFLAAHGGAEQ